LLTFFAFFATGFDFAVFDGDFFSLDVLVAVFFLISFFSSLSLCL